MTVHTRVSYIQRAASIVVVKKKITDSILFCVDFPTDVNTALGDHYPEDIFTVLNGGTYMQNLISQKPTYKSKCLPYISNDLI